MNKYLILWSLLILVGIQISCSEPDPIDEPLLDPVALQHDINDFVWKGMNSEYYWQQDVPSLNDSKNDIQDDYFTYLNGFSDPDNLFESLLYKKGVEDRFSWFVEDYKVQNASFRGISDSYGFEFGLTRICSDCSEVIGFVTYVIPDSPASDAEIKRGDIFHSFNGTDLTIENITVINAFYNDSQISMEFSSIVNEVVTPNNKSVSLTIREVIENPVFYSDVITNSGGTKIGYLVYNGFKYTFHEELNNIFAEFKAQNIQELVLDLRYNGGGSILTSAYLASMIFGGANTQEVFAKLIYNNKNANENGAYPFFDTARIYDKNGDYSNLDNVINRLTNLSRLFVITSDDTASASEMIISGLSPFMQIVKVGTTTYGKNVGSYTVYDSPDFSQQNANPNHTMAMQPITFKVFNKLDESEYTLGFDPDYELIEYVSDMKPFGDLEEPLLSTALNVISGNLAKVDLLKNPRLKTELIFSSLDNKPFAKEMYTIPE